MTETLGRGSRGEKSACGFLGRKEMHTAAKKGRKKACPTEKLMVESPNIRDIGRKATHQSGWVKNISHILLQLW